jgi:hypothetical protein
MFGSLLVFNQAILDCRHLVQKNLRKSQIGPSNLFNSASDGTVVSEQLIRFRSCEGRPIQSEESIADEDPAAAANVPPSKI